MANILWGFIGKKQKNVTRQDNRLLVGDVGTYIYAAAVERGLGSNVDLAQ